MKGIVNMGNNKLTDEEISSLVTKSNANSVTVEQTVKNSVNLIRNLLVIGCGDGGCHIASDIKSNVPNTFVIGYNTSVRGLDNLNTTVNIIPAHEDGSGKVRSYSKEVFKKGAHKKLLDTVNNICADNKIDYIIVVSTTDGGTGSGMSPMAAKFISDNVDIPVIMVGVYPSLREDATAQFNAMAWQAEVEKIALPYFVFDNTCGDITDKATIHRMVNESIVSTMKFFSGNIFGDSNISVIDNRDMLMLTEHIGSRLMATVDYSRVGSEQSLDDYIIKAISKSNQIEPSNIQGMGVFVKGPLNIIEKLDTSLPAITDKYGDVSVRYTHIEESDMIAIGIYFTGSSSPSERLIKMKGRYEDIMSNKRDRGLGASSFLDDMNDPLGGLSKKSHKEDVDTSALDI